MYYNKLKYFEYSKCKFKLFEISKEKCIPIYLNLPGLLGQNLLNSNYDN